MLYSSCPLVCIFSFKSFPLPKTNKQIKIMKQGGSSVTFDLGQKETLQLPPGAQRPRSHSTIYTSADSIIIKSRIYKFLSTVLVIISYCMVLALFPISMLCCLKVIKEYERAVMFRLGRLLKGGCVGPGLIFILPCVDTYRKVDLRVLSFEVPPQEILSKDSVTVSVDAVVYFRINNPVVSVTNVSDAFYSTKLLAQTTLRNILGTKTLGEMLLERDHISQLMEMVLYEATLDWGVKVERVEVKDLRLPDQLMRAMAAEAEASREARAKVVAAEGEQRASRALKEAADVLSESPAALQLRYLQTLNHIAAEQTSTIMFPVPMTMKALLDCSTPAGLGSEVDIDELQAMPVFHRGSTSDATFMLPQPSPRGSVGRTGRTGSGGDMGTIMI